MRSNRAKLRAGVSMAATLPMLAGALALGIPAAHAADNPARDTLAGTKPAWATAKADKGATSDSAKVSARVYLAGKDATGLAAYAKSVSDPDSASYGKYLSAAQAQARFGATKAQVAAVKSWLTAAGLKVTDVTEHYVAVSGDVAAVEKAFGTQLHNYTKGSKTYRAPDKAASAPRPRRCRADRHRPGQRAAQGEQQGPTAAAGRRVQERRAVLLVLRLEHREHAAVRLRLEDPVRDQGLHGQAAACRVRQPARTPARGCAWPSPTRTPPRPSPSTRPRTRRRTVTRPTPAAS